MTETEGYVYFAIKTEDDSIEEASISEFIGIKPTGFRKMHSNGEVPVCTTWKISTEKVIDPDISFLIGEILSVIKPFKERLLALKSRYEDVYYVLEIVIWHGDNAAGFALENDDLRFLSEIGAVVDIDQYNNKDYI